jgi:hypothetical protein
MLTNLHGQDYLWPVDLPRRISSNFGENRSRRFHAGIDVQTKGLKGFELKAIASGHIWRVRTSSSGYGRALYLKLDDGNIAVYAHLDRFSPILEDLISLEQERLNSYTIDKHFAPGDFVVQKGDLLGFSGESGGAFGPHLHFELRDKSNRPLNPLTNGFSLEDGRLPVPKAISITPLNKDAVINGSLLPQIFPLQRIKTREYAFMDTIHVFGEVGLGISVVDHMSRMQNKFNIYGAVLSVDDNEQYRVEFERFAFDQSKLIELERDYSLKRLNDGEFHRLFADENSHGLGFISKQSDGKLALSPGYHRVLIKLYDAQKNLVNIKGVIYQAPPIDISVSEIERTMTSVKFRIEPKGIPFPITHFTCYSFKSKGFPEKAIEATETSRDGNGMIVTLPLEDIDNKVLQFIGINSQGAVSSPYHTPINLAPADYMTVDLDLTVRHLEESVVIQVEVESYLNKIPELTLRNSHILDLTDLQQVTPTAFITRPLSPEEFGGTTEIVVSFHGLPVRELWFPIHSQLSDNSKQTDAVSPKGGCSIQVSPTSFYNPTAYWVEDINSPVPVEGGTFLTKAYQLQPFDRPLQDAANVAIKLPNNIRDFSKSGIFYYHQYSGWTYLSSRFDEDKWMFFSSLKSLEAVAVIQDTIQPVIKNIFPGNGGSYAYEDVQKIKCTIKDELAGITGDKAIKITLDNKKQLFEYHPIKKEASFRLKTPLTSGDHLLIITAQDQVGNTSAKKISFNIK